LTKGQIHWTAGMTVGGLANETTHSYKRLSSSYDDWKVYDDFMGRIIKENEE
jgi:hypothetical protein